MALPRDEVAHGLLAELDAFEALVRSLDADDLSRPSRCEGWTVGDVAAHVVGTMVDVATGRLDGLGTPEFTERQVVERRGRTGAELADELAGARKIAADLLPAFDDETWAGPSPGGYEGTLGDGVEALWYDTYLHADDIRAALGKPSVRGGDGLRASVSHVAFELGKRGWGPATIALEDVPTFEVGGGGRRVEGDPFEFVLAATGRGDPTPFGVDNIYA
jgi:uncharacterized protein (TIGR03083 family)